MSGYSEKRYIQEGVIIKKLNYSEADRIFLIYTKGAGKVVAIAKGVRKMKSRKRSSMEMFNIIKFSAVKSHGIDLITEVELLKSCSVIRKNIKKMALAYYYCEIVDLLMQVNDVNEKVFGILVNALDTLARTNGLKIQKEDFLNKILTLTGFSDYKNKYAAEILSTVTEKPVKSERVGKLLVV